MADQLFGITTLEVWVVDASGEPLHDINVRLVYQNYSAEGTCHELTLTTDKHGHVLFSQQYGKASTWHLRLWLGFTRVLGLTHTFSPSSVLITVKL
jgi:hypothetical protein